MNKNIENSANNFINSYNKKKINECKKVMNFCQDEIKNLRQKIEMLQTIENNCKNEIYYLTKLAN